MSSSLDQLKKFTVIVADTGDINSIKKYRPQDATTNPSLVYAASQLPQYKPLVDDAIVYGRSKGNDVRDKVSIAMDKIMVNFGSEILKIIPGRVSTEVDARLSFDTEGTVKKARELIELYKQFGIEKDRILIKIATTWEGIRAAEQLEKEGIHCNMTLLFSLVQAAAAAEAGVTLISPFVGRITDYFKVKEGKQSYPPQEDPGVLSVREIFSYYKRHGYHTVVMGASFRNKEQVLELSGCDLLTVAPSLLDELMESSGFEVTRKLDPLKCVPSNNTENTPQKLNTDEKSFRWQLNEDEMATFKLAEGIRKFAADLVKLENEVKKRIEMDVQQAHK
jgi:transaldolase